MYVLIKQGGKKCHHKDKVEVEWAEDLVGAEWVEVLGETACVPIVGKRYLTKEGYRALK